MSESPSWMPYDRLPAEDRGAGSHLKGEIELVGSTAPVVYEDKYVVLLRDPVIFPGGKNGSYLRLFPRSALEGRHGVVTVPTFGDEIFLIRLFRHPIRAWSLELPRGFAEPGASDEDNTRREIQEELGVPAGRVWEIGRVAPDTGLLATRAKVFHVELMERPAAAASSASQKDEAITRVVAMPRHEFLSGLKSGTGPAGGIECGFTLSALLLAQARGIIS